MKKLALSLLSASCLMTYAASAEAEMRWPNWYLGLHGALTFVGEEDTDGNATISSVDLDSGGGYGVSLGYRPRIASGEWSNMRIEAQWHHQRSDLNKVNTTTGTFDGNGSMRANAAMLNLYYDAAISMPEWRPYVGAGLGVAEIQLKNAGGSLAASNADDTVFAWNLMAGLGYVPEWLPYTEWSVGYRYFATADAEFAATAGGTFDVEYDSHNIEGGIKFLF